MNHHIQLHMGITICSRMWWPMVQMALYTAMAHGVVHTTVHLFNILRRGVLSQGWPTQVVLV